MSHPDHAADQRAAAAVVAHHAQLAEALAGQTRRLLDAVEHGDQTATEVARRDLLGWLRDDLVPHALAEERTLYPAAAALPGGALLVDGMLDEHRAITALVDELDGTADAPVRAAAAGRALTAVFATHLAKENTLVLPLLVVAGEVSLAGLLDGMHALLGGHDQGQDREPDRADAADPATGCGCGDCGCGGAGPADAAAAAVLSLDPRVDVRDLPHEHRHAHALAALDAVPPGGALVLVAGHPPRPLLAEVAARYGNQFQADWLQSGPQVWQIRLHRTPTRA
jgi:uncharacterized protein (DUF2249 family)/iron-sulfur cluster repair protein YtfE (RIC family)